MNVLNPDELYQKGHNVLITGSAGTGKSTLLHNISTRCRQSGRNVAVTATTGINVTGTVTDKSMAMVDFYHYTTTAGKKAIVESGVIKQSGSSRDAHFGDGVYGTSLSPEAGKKMIAENNWDDKRKISKKMLLKAAWAIKIRIPENDLRIPDTRRDILIYPGDLLLANYDWEVAKVQII